ncbi:Leucine-rich melanocyte differentiation-associated protein [Merluccius polli]|uniref:Leucine-rich melanocyte differentiation-associated protein n=1 Tax=Merluccius polli TaxID=89951 RepID=A0AA47MIY6_MERPO|nr:Leucine-rich melanocyte differentiation-associated protein [Merluccius polli]
MELSQTLHLSDVGLACQASPMMLKELEAGSLLEAPQTDLGLRFGESNSRVRFIHLHPCVLWTWPLPRARPVMDQAVPTQASCFPWLSFAHQGLSEVPYEAILEHSCSLEALDLSYNLLLERLRTLILDCNHYTSHVKFPFMPSVTVVCINKNKINNLPVFVEEIRRKFPNIKILSMMNNEAAPSYFNGGSLTQYEDYRQYVISQLPGLEILDDTEVLEKERVLAAKTYRIQKSKDSSRKRRELLHR